MAIFGPPNVERLAAKGDVAGLIRALAYPKEEAIRLAAAEAVGRLGSPAAVQPLTMLVSRDPSVKVRRAAARALGQIGGNEAVAPLIGALQAADESLRSAAEDALCAVGAHAVGPLIAASAGQSSTQKLHAVRALGRIGDPQATSALAAVLPDRLLGDAAAQALARLGPEGHPPLIAALHHAQQPVRLTAARALKQAGWQAPKNRDGVQFCLLLEDWDGLVEIGARAVDRLGALLREGPRQSRERAAGALSRIGAPAARALIPLLHDPDQSFRALAAQALADGGWKPTRDADGVAYCLERRDWDGLVEMGEAAVAPLLALLSGDDAESGQQAARCLGLIGAPAVEALVSLLDATRPATRALAAQALETAGWQPGGDARGVAYCLERGDWDGLVRIGEPAVDRLVATLRGDDAQLREKAADALQRIGAPAQEALVGLLGKGGPAGLLAADLLRKSGWRPGKDTAGVAFYLAVGDWEGAAQMGQAAIGPLISALGDADWAHRERAVRALVRMGEPAAKALVAVLCDPKSRNRRQAADTLAAMGWQPDKGEIGATYWAVKGEWEKCAELGPVAVKPLEEVLRAEGGGRPKDIALALAWIGEDSAIKALASALRDGAAEVRMAGADGLVLMGDARAVQALRGVLADRHSNGRGQAALALDRIKDRGARDALATVLNDEDWEVRLLACRALVSAADGRGVESLISALDNGDYAVRFAASRELARMYASKGLPAEWKRKILEQKGRLVSAHTDKRHVHEDWGSRTAISDCTHTDSYGHMDVFDRLSL